MFGKRPNTPGGGGQGFGKTPASKAPLHLPPRAKAEPPSRPARTPALRSRPGPPRRNLRPRPSAQIRAEYYEIKTDDL
jgi:hypothetical protein